MAWGVLTFMVDEWASQLTLMDHELFARVIPWDFFHQATIPHFCWFNPSAYVHVITLYWLIYRRGVEVERKKAQNQHSKLSRTFIHTCTVGFNQR